MANHKQQSLQRLRTIEGHVRGVHRMVEEDEYCINILMQINAIQSEDAQERERVIGELMQVMNEQRR